jgi:hypothetical protein
MRPNETPESRTNADDGDADFDGDGLVDVVAGNVFALGDTGTRVQCTSCTALRRG